MTIAKPSRPPAPGRAALLICASMLCAASAAAAPLRMGVNNGLANATQVAMDNASQALADVVSNATGQKVLWSAHFTVKTAQDKPGTVSDDFAFVKPPVLTAKLLAQGWQLVAVAQDTIGFGTDLIAPACPGKPGEVQIGGPGLSVLQLPTNIPETCMPVAKVWTAPNAVLLSPAAGSPVDRMAIKMWKRHAPTLPQVVHVKTQNAVTGLMQEMGVKAVGVVTPLVSKQWVAHGGVLLDHEPMPFWAMIAAPDTPPALVAKVRAALLSPASAEANKALHIPGWETGDPATYAAFLKKLNSD